jgi:hypothetical protein
MTHTHADKRCTSLNCERTHDSTGDTRNQPPGTKWRSALAALVAAPVRLHRYRHFHAEVVEDALRAFDCRKCP